MSSGPAPLETNLQFLRRLIRERSAIDLDETKNYLVEARLEPIAVRAGFRGLEELVHALRGSPPPGLLKSVVEAMTTNETSFYRDLAPFECLKQVVVPKLIEARRSQRALRVWCGACSSGQEPYSVLLLLKEAFPELNSWQLSILATDINSAMVERTRQGVYNQLEMNRGLPAQMLLKSFERRGTRWAIKPELREMVDAQELNLVEAWPIMGQMDIIFLRNVLIYFNVLTKRSILSRVKSVLAPDGFLFLGGAETPVGVEEGFERVDFAHASCYRLSGGGRSG